MRCQTLFFTLLLFSATSPSAVIAGPEGGQVIGGSGNISQSGLNTTINQSTQNMAIDWQSYNVNANERVQYIQPNDFMNGNYIFAEVLGTGGTVINSGIINASLGGNVALIASRLKTMV